MLKTFSNKGEAGAIPINAENLNFNFTELINILYPIGSYFDTSDVTFDPNVVWCGTWILETDGTVLVSKSSTTGSAFNTTIGSIVGEETHTLTVAETPKHAHQIPYSPNDGGDTVASRPYIPKSETLTNETNGRGWGNAGTSYVGNGQPHNNIQPSKICFRWHRTA